MELPDGLYDQVLTEALWRSISSSTDDTSRTLQGLRTADAPQRLTELLAQQLIRILDDIDGEGLEKLQRQLELIIRS